jgi:NAD(P)-dependent dehydrogenase (short-subunit alcohol dehydrogenase family)
LIALQTSLNDAGLGDHLATQHLDTSDAKACAVAVENMRQQFGTIDILINNAALGMGEIRDDHMTNLVSIEELTPAVWDKFIAVNLSGAWYLTWAAVPHMKRAGWGRIITVTTSMFTMLRGQFHPYGPAKAALEAMSSGHAKEFAEDGVTVNIVVPGGPADTPMVPEVSGFARADLVAPAKMVAPILWLCSSEADRVTGMRYVAANWDDSQPVAVARAGSEAPIAWPALAEAPVWPGSKLPA